MKKELGVASHGYIWYLVCLFSFYKTCMDCCMAFDIEQAVDRLEKEVANYQVPVVDLIAAQTKDPFKILVATILSARTKDEVTAEASRRLFARAQTVEQLTQLSVSELEKIIYPVGFFRNKAGYLAALPAVLQEKFSGQVPDTIDELVQLPGVGRKTANLVVAVAFGKTSHLCRYPCASDYEYLGLCRQPGPPCRPKWACGKNFRKTIGFVSIPSWWPLAREPVSLGSLTVIAAC